MYNIQMAKALFGVRLNKNIYKIFVVNNKDNQEMFLDEVKQLGENTDSKQIKICFDYEFNNNKIGLAQVMISQKNSSNNIFLFDPKKFNKNDTDFIKNNLYLNKHPKILHGSESLDIPYIYNQVLDNNKDMIKKFTSTISDTRFKCELAGNFKCSLYEALLNSGSINIPQYDSLQAMYKRNGKIYKMYWNADKMSLDQYTYAAFDVVFLRRMDRLFNKDLKSKGYNKTLFNEYTRYTFLVRNNQINFNGINKSSVSDEDIIKFTKINMGLKIQYFKNPIIDLIRMFINNKVSVGKILDNNHFKLIKDDLEKLFTL